MSPFVCFCASEDCRVRGCARFRHEPRVDTTHIKYPPDPITDPCVRQKTPQERAADLLEEAARILRGGS